MGPRWLLLLAYAVISTLLLGISPVFGTLGWAVPPLVEICESLLLLNASAAAFAVLLPVTTGIGVGAGWVLHRRVIQ